LKRNTLNKKQENDLFEAWAYCDWLDKSTEFMLEYMQSVAKIGLNDVLDFIRLKSKDRPAWYKKNPGWHKKYQNEI
jgi:hypothetical protein